MLIDMHLMSAYFLFFPVTTAPVHLRVNCDGLCGRNVNDLPLQLG